MSKEVYIFLDQDDVILGVFTSVQKGMEVIKERHGRLYGYSEEDVERQLEEGEFIYIKATLNTYIG